MTDPPAAHPATPCTDEKAQQQCPDIPESLYGVLKEHQIEGVQFMLRCLREDDGCILAHSMGLGKTAQVVTMSYALLQKDECNTILILTPKSTLMNWRLEFEKWGRLGRMLSHPKFKIFDCEKSRPSERLTRIRQWSQSGGVLFLGYEQYVSLVSEKLKRKHNTPDLQKLLRNPGPDVLVCDEGHRIKSTTTQGFKALIQLKTQRRVILTGTPLQNNLMEYFAMVNFVRKDFFTRTWFTEYFKGPIEAGQKWDASREETKTMRERAYVLSQELNGFVLRKDQSILQASLPEKSEYVLFIPLSDNQAEIYKTFREAYFARIGVRRNLLSYISSLNKIGVHPDLLKTFLEKKTTSGKKEWETTAWADDVLELYNKSTYTKGSPNESPKMLTLLFLYMSYRQKGQKMLVFSQYVETLDMVESFLARMKDHDPSTTYRLDGQCSSKKREDAMQKFQSQTGTAVFLISTRAGGVGINLNTAHCAILLDVSFNPAHDQQAVFRCYRYGLRHPVSIYRLVSSETPEGYVYNRCLAKEWVSKKVVDESAPTRDFVTTVNLQSLLHEEEDQSRKKPLPDHLIAHYHKERAFCLSRDPVLSSVVTRLRKRNIDIRQIHRHESLLLDSAEEAPGAREERAYENYRSADPAERQDDVFDWGERDAYSDTATETDDDDSDDEPAPRPKKKQGGRRELLDDTIEEANGELDFATAMKIAAMESAVLEEERKRSLATHPFLHQSPGAPPTPSSDVAAPLAEAFRVTADVVAPAPAQDLISFSQANGSLVDVPLNLESDIYTLSGPDILPKETPIPQDDHEPVGPFRKFLKKPPRDTPQHPAKAHVNDTLLGTLPQQGYGRVDKAVLKKDKAMPLATPTPTPTPPMPTPDAYEDDLQMALRLSLETGKEEVAAVVEDELETALRLSREMAEAAATPPKKKKPPQGQEQKLAADIALLSKQRSFTTVSSISEGHGSTLSDDLAAAAGLRASRNYAEDDDEDDDDGLPFPAPTLTASAPSVPSLSASLLEPSLSHQPIVSASLPANPQTAPQDLESILDTDMRRPEEPIELPHDDAISMVLRRKRKRPTDVKEVKEKKKKRRRSRVEDAEDDDVDVRRAPDTMEEEDDEATFQRAIEESKRMSEASSFAELSRVQSTMSNEDLQRFMSQ